MVRTASLLAAFVSLGILAGCSEPEKPTQEEIQTARASDPTMRQIDKSRDVAAEAGTRVDDPALH